MTNSHHLPPSPHPVDATIIFEKLQVNFCISNTDMSNTMQVSKWDDGPGRFNYIYDLRKPRYLEHINLEYLAYLEVDWRFQELKHTHYFEVHEISRSTEFTPTTGIPL